MGLFAFSSPTWATPKEVRQVHHLSFRVFQPSVVGTRELQTFTNVLCSEPSLSISASPRRNSFSIRPQTRTAIPRFNFELVIAFVAAILHEYPRQPRP